MNTKKEYVAASAAAEIECQIDSNIKIIDSIFSNILSSLGLHHEIANSLSQAAETNKKLLVEIEQNCSTQKEIDDYEMEESSPLIGISDEGILENNPWPILYPLTQQC
ncbi:hypothetical protein ACTFIY_011444 [Dictyostelium cf. discoideum]